jgi:hypothetical protein
VYTEGEGCTLMGEGCTLRKKGVHSGRRVYTGENGVHCGRRVYTEGEGCTLREKGVHRWQIDHTCRRYQCKSRERCGHRWHFSGGKFPTGVNDTGAHRQSIAGRISASLGNARCRYKIEKITCN